MPVTESNGHCRAARRRLARSPANAASPALAGERGPWRPASRWWHGNAPEWDVVARSLDGRSLLLGEAKWSPRPVSGRALERAAAELERRPAPPAAVTASDVVVRALLVPELEGRAAAIASRRPGPLVITARDLLA